MAQNRGFSSISRERVDEKKFFGRVFSAIDSFKFGRKDIFFLDLTFGRRARIYQNPVFLKIGPHAREMTARTEKNNTLRNQRFLRLLASLAPAEGKGAPGERRNGGIFD